MAEMTYKRFSGHYIKYISENKDATKKPILIFHFEHHLLAVKQKRRLLSLLFFLNFQIRYLHRVLVWLNFPFSHLLVGFSFFPFQGGIFF